MTNRDIKVMGNIKDRGNKWSMAMMLPEHIERIKSCRENDEKTEKPQLDDFELELIADDIMRAFKSKSTIKLTYWRDGHLKEDYGKIIGIE